MPGPKKVSSFYSHSWLVKNLKTDNYSDHEIFRLRDEVEIFEGEGTTFYG